MSAVIELPDAIIDLSDYDESVNYLLYADSGVGKTVHAGGSGLILGVEQGTVSAKRQGSTAKLWPIHSWMDLQRAYAWLKKNPDAFPWVALDSVTAMQQLALKWILEKEYKNAGGAQSSRDIDIPQIQDHQKWQNMFKRFIKGFCDLPVNVLFTALPLHVEDEEGMALVLPDLSGKGYQIAQWVCAQMSVVGYMKKIRKKTGVDSKDEPIYKEVRRVYFQYKAPHFAKDRYDVLGKYWDDPTLAEIDARIKGETKPPEKTGKPGEGKAGASNRSRNSADREPPAYSQTEGQDPAENPLDEDIEDITMEDED